MRRWDSPGWGVGGGKPLQELRQTRGGHLSSPAAHLPVGTGIGNAMMERQSACDRCVARSPHLDWRPVGSTQALDSRHGIGIWSDMRNSSFGDPAALVMARP